MFSQSTYCDGWETGYKEGFCYQKNGCVPPTPPNCPVQRVGENGYKAGYNRGFTNGKLNNSSESTNIGGAYGQLKPLENTNLGNILEDYSRNNHSTKIKNKRKKLIQPPLIIEETNISDFNKTTSDTKNNDSLIELSLRRENAIKIINVDFQRFKNGNENLNRIAKSESNDLIISIQMPIKMKYNDFQRFENEFVERLCFVTSMLIINNKELKDYLMKELEYQNLIFKIELACNSRKKVNRTKKLHKLSLENLKLPLEENELNKVLF